MLSRHQIERVVDLALEEDAPFGDLTSEAFIPAGALATADLVARSPAHEALPAVPATARSRSTTSARSSGGLSTTTSAP